MIKPLLVFALLFAATPAQAFIFIRAGAYAKGERPVSKALMWAGRTVTFRVNTDQTVYSGSIVPELTTAEFQSALNDAIAAWNNICGSDVQVKLAGTTTNTTAGGDSVNTVSWDNRTTAEGNQVASTGTLAVAYSSVVNATSTSVDCDIVVNGEATGNFGVNGEGAKYDLVGILVHEIGHCLGLDHSIEPPTFTSANSILLAASMKSTVAAGDTGPRTLSQDEIDGMECVNSQYFGARSGTYCTSYHGSNGGGALSGTVSGGPTSERACGDGQSAAVKASTTRGGGCVTNAIAQDGSAPAEPFTLGWGFLTALFLALRFAYRRARGLLFFLPAVLLFPASPAEAALELSYQLTSATPALVNNASAFTTAEGTFASTKASPAATFTRFGDLYGSLSFSRDPAATWGIYYKSSLKKEIELKGYNSADVLLVTKRSSLSGWVVGLNAKWLTGPETARILRLFFELQGGIGKTEYKQSIVDSTATHALNASATVVDLNAYLGAQYPVYESLDVVLKLGYSRLQSNFYTVDSAAGTRYAGMDSGERVALRTGEDLRLVRNGFGAQAGLALVF